MSESTFETLRVTFVILFGLVIPVPEIRQVFSSKTSVTTYNLFEAGSKVSVILSSIFKAT